MTAQSLLAIALAGLAGAMVALQPAFNAQLARHLEHPLKAAFVSFAAGATILAIILTLTRATIPTSQQIAATPGHLWVVGGALGAFFVTVAIWSAPRLGVAAYLSIIVAAQLTAAVLIDHFGLAGLVERTATPTRLFGIALLIAGAVFVNRG